jgi:hypothetical protein
MDDIPDIGPASASEAHMTPLPQRQVGCVVMVQICEAMSSKFNIKILSFDFSIFLFSVLYS